VSASVMAELAAMWLDGGHGGGGGSAGRPFVSERERKNREFEREKEQGGASGLQTPMGGATKADEPAEVGLGSGSH